MTPAGPPPSAARSTTSAPSTRSRPRLHRRPLTPRPGGEPGRRPRAKGDRGVRSTLVSTAQPASPARETSLFAGVEPLEVFVDLLSEIESDTTSSEFYHRI